jgi:flagellar hook-associated protein 2
LALGVGSSLDVNSLVTQLMAAEQQPIAALATKEAKYQSQLTAYGSLKGALSTFQSSVAALSNPTKFTAVSASITDTSLATVSASSSAIAGVYSVSVDQLAQSQKLQSSALSATSTTLGSGTLTISFGTYTYNNNAPPTINGFTLNPDKATKTVTIAPSQSSLSGVQNAINAANVGVSANIINNGTGYHLVITSTDSGISNAVRITVADSSDSDNTDVLGLSRLTYNPAGSPAITRLTQSTEPKNALLTVDGISISKASNAITDAIAGVNLNLQKSGTSNMTVKQDTASIQSAVQAFVAAYNSLNSTISNLSKYDLVNKKAAVLTGDSALNSLKSQLRTVFNTPLSKAGGGLTALSDVGIIFQKDGTLALNTSKLNSVMNDPSKDVSTLFAAIGKPSDSLIRFNNSTTDTKNGIYAVKVTSLATQGSAVGNKIIPSDFVITGTNDDGLSLTVDGISATIKVASGTYHSAGDLAAELQSKINGSSAFSSSKTTVTVSSQNGVLTITSNRYGLSSKVSDITDTASGNIFDLPTYTTGQDAAGQIDGVVATGSGQSLTAGTGNAKGLTINITGGTAGPDMSRGTVSFARGYAYELNTQVTRMLDSKNLVDSRMSGISASITKIGKDREQVNLHLAAIEKRYKTQFTALDGMLNGMNQTSNFLTQQLANLNSITNSK